MAKHDSCDDPGDSDYDPKKKGRCRKPNVKISTAASKAGASFLPTPDPTPTDLNFATELELSQLAPYAQQILQQARLQGLLPTPRGTAFYLNGMLRHDDEVLNAQLNFSRRGAMGHCSRDTADVWFYILRLFFPAEEGYQFNVTNYHEQAREDEYDTQAGTAMPGGTAVTIQVLKHDTHFHPLHRQWVTTASTPILAVVCGSIEARFAEYPAARHRVDGSQDLRAATPLQTALYDRLCASLVQHNTSVAHDGYTNRAAPLKAVSGAVACGSMVRFFKVRADKAGDGWFRTWSARGLDLVNGDPSASLGCVERILGRIKDPTRKGNLGKM